MKKNLYDIMNEADEKNLGTLIDGVEYETPSDISEKRIEAKVMAKTGLTKTKKKISRALFIKWGAAAACLALIICAYPMVKNFTEQQPNETGKINIDTHKLAAEEFAYEKEMTYTFYYPAANGLCNTFKYTETLNEGKSSETMVTLMTRFFDLCGINGIIVVDSKVETEGEKTEYSEFQGQTIVTHTVGKRTLTLYLEGTADLDDFTLKCLVNTLDSISYADYFKISYNGELLAIDGEIPESGFTKFDIEVEYDHGEPAETTSGTNKIPTDSTTAAPAYNPIITSTGEYTLPYIPE